MVSRSKSVRIKTRSEALTPMQRTAFSAPNCKRSSNDMLERSSSFPLERILLNFPVIHLLLNRVSLLIIDEIRSRQYPALATLISTITHFHDNRNCSGLRLL